MGGGWVAECRCRPGARLTRTCPKCGAFFTGAFDHLGLLAQRARRLTDAFEAHSAALAIDERLGERQRAASSLRQLGNVLAAMRDDSGALDCYGRALEHAAAAGDERCYALTQRRMADVELRHSRWAEALTLYTESMQRLERIGANEAERGARRTEMLLAQARLGNTVPTLGAEPDSV